MSSDPNSHEFGYGGIRRRRHATFMPLSPAAAMPVSSDADSLLIERIRRGEGEAWSDLIMRYEGRLLAFVESRLGRRGPSEDIVQEAFLGFLNSLPNYDGKRPLESYLFSICAYKLTDHLRREGRRPAVPLSAGADSTGDWQLQGSDRPASSIARSGERKDLEEKAVSEALADQIERWRERGEWTKSSCSSAAGRIRTRPRSSTLASSRWPTTNSTSSPACEA
jgi:RNA polymerase sigma-70 factor (ECF subfamily)